MARGQIISLNHAVRWLVAVALSMGSLWLPPTSSSWAKTRSSGKEPRRVEAKGHLGGAWTWNGAVSQARDPERVLTARRGRRGPSSQNGGPMGGGWGDSERLSPQERERVKRKYDAWKSLSPEKRRLLRQRWKQWQGLPPGERSLYERRFHQWQELSPEEREGIRRKLERWKTLSPEEKEQLRHRFR